MRKKTDEIVEGDEIQFPVYDEAEFYGIELAQIQEIIREVKEDIQLRNLFLVSILEDEEIFTALENHFADWFGSKGMLLNH